MKEITRIHIAKTAYDIEIDAKKELEAYIKELEHYASDPEILDDIEIRVTELLAEHGVAAGGVITKKDVAAVRAQLGEPTDFAAEDVEMYGATEDTEPRRVYRDEDGAVLGGVLAGFGKFFGVDPLWVRLVFIVLLFASFGTALLVYLILWLIVPPAQTAAEKLRMSGRSVTLASIKELAGTEEQRSEKAVVMQRILGGMTGAILVLLAVGGLMAIAAVVVGVQFGFGPGEIVPVADRWIYSSWWFMTAMGLFIVSGLLFSALCFILASAAFRRQWSKRIGVAVVAIIASGFVVFVSGVGTGIYGVASEQARIDRLHQNTWGAVPENFNGIKTFTFTDTGIEGAVPVQYIVSDTPRYELDAFPGVEPRFEVADDGLSAKVRLVNTDGGANRNARSPFGSLGFGMTVLRVYGAALDGVEAASVGSLASYHNEVGQAKLAVKMHSGSSFNLEGKYDTVHVAGDTSASVSLEDAVISELYVEGGGRVTAGVVRLLSVTQPEVCAAGNYHQGIHFVQVYGISGGTFIYNGKEEPARTISNSCGRVVVGDEYDLGEEW